MFYSTRKSCSCSHALHRGIVRCGIANCTFTTRYHPKPPHTTSNTKRLKKCLPFLLAVDQTKGICFCFSAILVQTVEHKDFFYVKG